MSSINVYNMRSKGFLLFYIALLLPLVLKAEFNGAGYYRVHNSVTKRYISVIGKSYKESTDPDAFEKCVSMLTEGRQFTDPGSVIYINSITNNVALSAQGVDTYVITREYLSIKDGGVVDGHSTYVPYKEMFIWTFYLQDAPGSDGGTSAGFDLGRQNTYAKYWMEPLDVADNFFAVEPTLLYNGYYYTTLRVAFNYKLPEGVYAYVANKSTGKVTLFASPGEIIPSDYAVILRCESPIVTDNKLLPTTAAAKSKINSGLVKADAYFKYTVNAVRGNLVVQEGDAKSDTNPNYRVLGVRDGQLGFYETFWDEQDRIKGPGVVSCLDGNRAYMNVTSDVNLNGLPKLNVNQPVITSSATEVLQGDIISATISCSTDGAAIEYSLDGTNWSDYSGQLTFTQNCTLYAKAVKNGVESDIATATYTFTALSAPSITPTSAEAVVGETITFTATNPNGGSSTMQYRIDGGAWTTTTGTITVTSNEAKTGTVEVKVINGNAESSVASATYIFAEAYQDIKLANLVNKPVDDTKYNITDLTCIYVIDNAGLLICKDDTCYASKDVTENGWIDYMQQVSGLNVPETYDQSNWIALRLPQGTAVTNDMIHAPLSGVKGHLVNANNLEFQLDVKPQFGSRVEFTPNTYIPASFKGTQESPVTGKTYFFVQPKPMEYAHIEWAVSRGDKFITSPRDIEHGINTAGLSGEFEFNGMYLGDFDLQWDHVYKMDAIIKRFTDNFDHAAPSAKAPRLADAQAQARYIVYPVTIQQTSESVITGVMNVAGVREVAAVEYVNLAGQRSSRPWQGVNIVITRYTDGTVTTAKECK